METSIDFARVKEKTKNITVFLSDSDPYDALEENSKGFKKELDAKLTIKKRQGHFTADDGITEIPEVVNTLESWIR